MPSKTRWHPPLQEQWNVSSKTLRNAPADRLTWQPFPLDVFGQHLLKLPQTPHISRSKVPGKDNKYKVGETILAEQCLEVLPN